MGKKRSFSALHNEVPEHGAPQPHTFDYDHPAKKTRKRNQTHEPKTVGVGQAKKRARAIQRLFQKDDKLPQNVRRDFERELVSLEKDITNRSQHKRRSQMISKYHMVRFFERRKAERLVSRLQAKIKETSDPDNLASLRADLHIADVDLHYTKYFPFLEPYISLYPKAKGNKDTPKHGEPGVAEAALRLERPSIWKEIELAMEQGERALVILREREPLTESTPRQKGKSKTRENIQSGVEMKPNPKSADRTDKDWNHDKTYGDESDGGGFFDEDD